MDNALSLFTKVWKTPSAEELGAMVKEMGFDGIELPLRPGYQVEPEDAPEGLRRLAGQLAQFGLKIYSVAAGTPDTATEAMFFGCANAGIPIIRMMAPIDAEKGYWESEAQVQRQIEQLLPYCEKYHVKVGIQMHYGWWVSTSMQLWHLVERFDPRYVGAIWDSAHSGLAGEYPENGLDMVSSHLCMVNLKNAFYRRANGPEAAQAEWTEYFTSAPHGRADWGRILHSLSQRRYDGVICLTAEYTDEENTSTYIRQDVALARRLLAGLQF